MFTNLSKLAFTVGVLIPVSWDIWRNDLRPSFSNSFRIDMSVSVSLKANMIYVDIAYPIFYICKVRMLYMHM